MSELINKYTEAHSRFIDALTKYYPMHEDFLEKQSAVRTAALRGVIREMRLALREMADVAQERRHERQKEWLAAHPDAAEYRKIKFNKDYNEHNNKPD
jgi:hypothetical protein